MGPQPPFFTLPPELLHHILSYLSPPDLSQAGATCHTLSDHANNDLLWQRFVNSNLPHPLSCPPATFTTFKALYIAHHPFWFLVRNKIWFCDIKDTGKLILARYNTETASIEAFRVVARHSTRQNLSWTHNPDVTITLFDPEVSLWLDDPVIQLNKFVPSPLANSMQWRDREIRMPMAIEAQRVFNNLILCRKIPDDQKHSLAKLVWPPRLIPANERIDVTYSDQASLSALEDKPSRVDEICESGFRLRKWVQFGHLLTAFDTGTLMNGISTYATLDPELYTPTPEKPYQGIWVGDYSGHGPEFLLILQNETYTSAPTIMMSAASQDSPSPVTPDTLPGPPEEEVRSLPPSSTRRHGQNQSQNQNQSQPATGTRETGRLEAIKLTGDPNVPRGSITFFARDIGSDGFVRIAEEEIFRGARVVESWGHVSTVSPRVERMIPGELILISHDCVAHYWSELEHVSFYRRVDIDGLLRQGI